MDRRLVTDAVKAALAAGTGKAVEVGRAPASENLVIVDGLLVEPYQIVYPIPGAPGDNALDGVETHWALEYQLTSVGARGDHAQAMADLGRAVMTGRAASGAFTTPITVAGAVVIDRRSTLAGGPEPAGGGLWQVVDSFTVELA